MTAPSMFSSENPRLQIAWDATSLKAFGTCPRYYQLSILEGWRGTSVDLEFGGFFASATETYKKARLSGHDKQSATLLTLRSALANSWQRDGGPWGGSYQLLWRCTGTEPYRNGKGNRAKCPWAKKGSWFPGVAPEICGSCGSHTHAERRWVPDDHYKDRPALFRLIAGWCDAQAETTEDGAFPMEFANREPAVELSFKFPLPFKSQYGEPYILAGHLDSIETFAGENFICDNKTTRKAMTEGYWAQWKPNVQVATYDLAGAVLYPQLQIRGVKIDAAQILVGNVRFATRVYYSTAAEREEYLRDLQETLQRAERYASAGYWPMERANCYTCPFKGVCSKPPERRDAILRETFEQRHWNPLEER